MSQKEIITFEDTGGMAGFLSSFIAAQTETLTAGQLLNIALSGGNTPKTIFEKVRLQHREQINWQRIRFFQVDERCVSPDDPQSNYRMISESLLEGLGFPENQFIRMKGENDPEREATRYEELLREILPSEGGWPVFDLILLGLGNDGHTASLFPGDEAILRSLNCCEVAKHPESRQNRITLTLPVINHARTILFLVTGQEKAEVVANIFRQKIDLTLPASLVNPAFGAVTWLIGKEAALLIS